MDSSLVDEEKGEIKLKTRNIYNFIEEGIESYSVVYATRRAAFISATISRPHNPVGSIHNNRPDLKQLKCDRDYEYLPILCYFT